MWIPLFCTHSMPMTHLLRCLMIETFIFHWVDILSFQSRPSWFLFCKTLKDTRDWIQSTRRVFENFSCHSCIFNLCIIFEKNNIDTPLLSKDISFSYESSICVPVEYSKRCSQEGVCYCFFQETTFCEQLDFSV